MPIRNIDKVEKAIEAGSGKRGSKKGIVPDESSPWARAVARGVFVAHRDDPLPPEKREFLNGYPDRVFSAGDAGKCSRQHGFKVFGLGGGTFDLAGRNRMWRGTVMHEEVEEYIKSILPVGVVFESEVGVATDDGFLVGFVDGLVTWPGGKRTVLEVKTTSPGGYVGKLGAYGDPGPQYSHVAQGAIYAHLLEADELVVLYVNQSALDAKGRKNCRNEVDEWAVSWTFTRREASEIAVRELERMRAAHAEVAAGVLPDPKFADWQIPADAVVTGVGAKGGAWMTITDEGGTTRAGTNWACKYCDWLPMCAEIGVAQETEVELMGGETHLNFTANRGRFRDEEAVERDEDGVAEHLLLMSGPADLDPGEGPIIDADDPRLVPDWIDYLVPDIGDEEE